MTELQTLFVEPPLDLLGIGVLQANATGSVDGHKSRLTPVKTVFGVKVECDVGRSRSRPAGSARRLDGAPAAALSSDRHMREFPKSRWSSGAMLTSPICFVLDGARFPRRRVVGGETRSTRFHELP